MQQSLSENQAKQPVRPPTWVTDPKNGKDVDVAAFLEILEEFDTMYSDSTSIGEGGVAAIREVIRLMNLTEFNPSFKSPSQLVDLYQDLYRLETMFIATRDRVRD